MEISHHNNENINYKKDLFEHLGPKQIDMVDLIEGIISLYGYSIEEKKNHSGNYITSVILKKFINDIILDNILNNILTEKIKDLVFDFNNHEKYCEIIKFIYFTENGLYSFELDNEKYKNNIIKLIEDFDKEIPKEIYKKIIDNLNKKPIKIKDIKYLMDLFDNISIYIPDNIYLEISNNTKNFFDILLIFTKNNK